MSNTAQISPYAHFMKYQVRYPNDMYWDGEPIEIDKEAYGCGYMDDQRAWEHIQPLWIEARRERREKMLDEKIEDAPNATGYVPTPEDIYWDGPPLPVDWEARAKKAAYAVSQIIRYVRVMHDDLGHVKSFLECRNFACDSARTIYEHSGVESWKAY